MKEGAERPEPTLSTEVPRKCAIFKAVPGAHFAERNGRVGKPAVRLWTPAGEVKCAKNSEGDVPSSAVGSAAFPPFFQNPIELSPAASSVASARR